MTDRSSVAVLASRVRTEEKLILAELRGRGVPVTVIDGRGFVVDLDKPALHFRGALIREISHTRGYYGSRLLEHAGVTAVNSSDIIRLCGDKLLTNLALVDAGVPTPDAVVALTPAAMLQHLPRFGFPAVVKPLTGSWGRLLARLKEQETAEAVLEHRQALPGPQHQITYVQRYVDKPGRDIRGYVFGGEVVGATYRVSGQWRTNTARGAETRPCPATGELERLLRAAAVAIGDGALAVDILEGGDGALLVNEVNHTPEFHASVEVLSTRLVSRYVDYVLRRFEEEPAGSAECGQRPSLLRVHRISILM
jgi:[lysine-biosynthesis-protein LysW]--L-2-aminoadipate ligase